MEQSDCVIINIVKGVECPMCGNDVTEKNMAKSCSKNIPDHHVCMDCAAQLKSNGFGDGCVYCGHRENKEKNIVIARARDIHPRPNNVLIIQEPHRMIICKCRLDDICLLGCSVLLVIIIIASIYTIGVIMFSVGQLIGHKINGEDHTHETEWSLKNCVMGYLGWMIVAYIMFQNYLLITVTYEKCCFPCGKKIHSYYKKICGSQSRNRVSAVE